MNTFAITINHPNVGQVLFFLKRVKIPLSEIDTPQNLKDSDGTVSFYSYQSKDKSLTITFVLCESYWEANELEKELVFNKKLPITKSTINGSALCIITSDNEELRMELISNFAGEE